MRERFTREISCERGRTWEVGVGMNAVWGRGQNLRNSPSRHEFCLNSFGAAHTKTSETENS